MNIFVIMLGTQMISISQYFSVLKLYGWFSPDNSLNWCINTGLAQNRDLTISKILHMDTLVVVIHAIDIFQCFNNWLLRT